jgi:hypothetical protein
MASNAFPIFNETVGHCHRPAFAPDRACSLDNLVSPYLLDNASGFRSGFDCTFAETTLGFIYHITRWCISRPEVWLDDSTGQKVYDNGTKRDQFTFNWTITIRF